MKKDYIKLFVVATALSASATMGASAAPHATAPAQRQAASAGRAGTVTCITPQQALSRLGADKATRLMEQMCPATATAIGHDTLLGIMANPQPLLSATPHKAPGDQGGTGFPGITDEQLAEIQIFIKQVLPLYIYQMEGRTTPPMADQAIYDVQNIYTTPKDGCYFGIGDDRNTYNPMGIDCDDCKARGGKLKANGSYVWGMVAEGDKLYWSTNNNYLCIPGYGMIATTGKKGPYENSCWVCEYDKGLTADKNGQYGDMQPPRIFEYDTKAGAVKDITPDDGLLATCQGLRSAAQHKGVVFFGGPTFAGASATASQGSVFLAYSPRQGKFIGSSDMAEVSGCKITNVRRWVVINDVLYCGVGLTTPDGVAKGGVLRWTGSEQEPFSFEIVGYTAGEAAEIEYHKGRIYVGGWPTANSSSAIYRSGVVPEGGLTADDATEWEAVWQYNQYEVSPTAVTYFSAMKSYQGRLYWGMFTGSYAAVFSAYNKYGTLESAAAIAHVLGTLRATTLWSTDDFTSADDIELLYGDEQLPLFNNEEATWQIVPNNSGYMPRYGRSGYGNLFTCYTWSMTEYNDKLYIGTMDMSTLIDPGLEGVLDNGTQTATQAPADQTGTTAGTPASALDVLKAVMTVNPDKYGYECLVMDGGDQPLQYVTDNGFGNPAAYGVRNMVVLDGTLFVGTANPQNLHERGGWEILSVTDNTLPNGLCTAATVKEAGIMYKQNEHYIQASTINGDAINKMYLTDMAGRLVYTAKPLRNEGYIFTQGIAPGTYIMTVQSASQQRSVKVMVK